MTAQDLRKDVVYAARALWRDKIFTMTAVAALSLGIGGSSAVYSVIKHTLIDPLPYPDANRILQFLIVSANTTTPNASIPKFALWRELKNVLVDVAGYNPRAPASSITGIGQPIQIRLQPITTEYFRLFGVPMERGRTFTEDEDRPSGPLVAVISHGLWLRAYGGDRNIIGKTIEIAGVPRTVIGVVGPQFEVDPAPDVWIPFQFDLSSTDQLHYFVAAARLRPGVTLDMVKAQLKVAEADFRAKFPNVMAPGDGFSAELLQESMVGDVRSSLLLLAGAVALVMLIACSNVASLLLFKAASRRQELAVKTALGASRGRIISQLLVESVLLFLVSGVVGTGLGLVILRLITNVDPGRAPHLSVWSGGLGLDMGVLAFTIGLSLVSGFIFGLVPAIGASGLEAAKDLKEAAGRTGSALGQERTRSILVIAELSTTVVLLVGATLLIRTFVALGRVDPGFDPRNVITMQMSLTGTRLHDTAGVSRTVDRSVERVESLAGVASVAAANALPLESRFTYPFMIVGQPLDRGQVRPMAGWTAITSEYFDVATIPLKEGRAFNLHDVLTAEPVVIINEMMKQQYWPRADPIDHALTIGSQDKPRRIVGIVGNIRDEALNRPPRPMMYVPIEQVPDSVTALNTRIRPFYWFVRTKGGSHGLPLAIRDEIDQASGHLPVGLIRNLDEIVEKSRSGQEFNMILVSAFAGTALILSAIGIYGLLAYAVEQRKLELGIRLCLGAEPADVLKLVALQGIRLACLGIGLGICAALALGQFLATLLYGVKPLDPLVFSVVTVLVVFVVMCAAFIPAVRASRINPIAAFRME